MRNPTNRSFSCFQASSIFIGNPKINRKKIKIEVSHLSVFCLRKSSFANNLIIYGFSKARTNSCYFPITGTAAVAKHDCLTLVTFKVGHLSKLETFQRWPRSEHWKMLKQIVVEFEDKHEFNQKIFWAQFDFYFKHGFHLKWFPPKVGTKVKPKWKRHNSGFLGFCCSLFYMV